ncbi:hypothetical protein AAHA92_04015 [Salvia divinorum]|uniref:Uncharacterized protein n=1 Tax=Salvia divinorum TaxID=28513 RepID=A0ABD1I134_SALDI
MAYNLQPLITVLEGILDPDQTRWIVHENNPQFQSILDKATSLQQLLDKSSLTELDSQIREVAHRAEDIIESRMVHQMISGYNSAIFTFTTPDLQQVILDLDSLMEQAEKLVEMEDNKMLPEVDSAMEQLKLVEMEDKKMPSSSSSSSKSAVVVGIDGDLMQLKDRLTSMEKKLEIVPIVGSHVRREELGMRTVALKYLGRVFQSQKLNQNGGTSKKKVEDDSSSDSSDDDDSHRPLNYKTPLVTQ